MRDLELRLHEWARTCNHVFVSGYTDVLSGPVWIGFFKAGQAGWGTPITVLNISSLEPDIFE